MINLLWWKFIDIACARRPDKKESWLGDFYMDLFITFLSLWFHISFLLSQNNAWIDFEIWVLVTLLYYLCCFYFSAILDEHILFYYTCVNHLIYNYWILLYLINQINLIPLSNSLKSIHFGWNICSYKIHHWSLNYYFVQNCNDLIGQDKAQFYVIWIYYFPIIHISFNTNKLHLINERITLVRKITILLNTILKEKNITRKNKKNDWI